MPKEIYQGRPGERQTTGRRIKRLLDNFEVLRRLCKGYKWGRVVNKKVGPFMDWSDEEDSVSETPRMVTNHNVLEVIYCFRIQNKHC